MQAAVVLALIELITEALKTFNMVYADLPAEQRREQAKLNWLAVKPLYTLLIKHLEEEKE